MADDQTTQDAEAILAMGITQTTTDGTSTSFDLDVLQKQLQEQRLRDPCAIANGQVRPPIMSAQMRYNG